MKNRKIALGIVTGLTLARIPAVLLFLAAALVHANGGAPAWAAFALAALVLGAVSDLFDGMLARRWRVTSQFGAHADPFSDKVFSLVSLPLLVYIEAGSGTPARATLLLILCVFSLLRDQWVSFLRALGAGSGISGRANWSGKLRTALAFPILCILYLDAAFGAVTLPAPLWYGGVGLLLALNLVSIWVYTGNYRGALRESLLKDG